MAYRVRRARMGASGVLLLTPEELLRRLCALVPPPRVHQVRYHGLFAPAARGRRALPAAAREANRIDATVAMTAPAARPKARCDRGGYEDGPRARRLDWAALLLRTFEEDVLSCDRCGARLRVMAFITAAETTRKILEHLGLPLDPPRVAPARDPPEQLLPGFEDGAVALEPVDPFPAGDAVDPTYEEPPA